MSKDKENIIIEKFHQECTRCNLCLKHCAFLQKHGNPAEIADTFDNGNKKLQNLVFECSLCELCATVCPAGLSPAEIFLEMRRKIALRSDFDFSRYKAILNYEKRGISERYSYYALPEKCDSVFFPGCTLSGTRPSQTFQLFTYLRKHFPNIGVVMDCCCKISHDLGLHHLFKQNFNEMKHFLEENGIERILTACPGCHKIISRYGDSLQVQTVYEIMSQKGLPSSTRLTGSVCIHDPCAVRHCEDIHAAIRHIVRSSGLHIEEMDHAGKNTVCCGEGGAANHIVPGLAGHWTYVRTQEAGNKKVITYCAGCSSILSQTTFVCHIIDLVFTPQAAIMGKVKAHQAPITYLNRILLKRRLKKEFIASVNRKREMN